MRRHSITARLTLLVLATVMLAGGITACGKRGDPYRPSEISRSGS